MPFFSMPINAWLRRAAWAFGALLAVWAVSWLLVPPLLKSQVQQRGSQLLGRTLTIAAVDFKPWSLELTLTDVKLASADGKQTQLSVARVYADVAAQSLWRMAPVVDAIAIEQPHLTLSHDSDGHLDIDDVLQRLRSAPDAPASAPLRFALYNVQLTDGSADLVEQLGGTKHSHSLRKLNLSLPFISSFESLRDVVVQPHLAFELNGSAFDSAAQATPFAQTRKGEVNLQVTHLDLAPYLLYLPSSLPVRLQSAVLDTSLKLSFEQSTSSKLVLSGAIKVSDLKMGDRLGAPLLSAASVQAVIKDLHPLGQSVTLESLHISDPQLWLHRNSAGQWMLPGADVQPLDRHEGKPAQPISAPVSAQPVQGEWTLAMDLFELQGGQVHFVDDSVTPSAKLTLADTQVQLRDVHWPMTQSVQLEASAMLQAQEVAKGSKPASIQVSGKGTVEAGSATLKLSDLGLALAKPYLAQVLLPQVRGALEGEMAANWKDGDVTLQAKRLALHDFALTQPPGKTEFAPKELPVLKLLEVSDLTADLQKHALTVSKLALRSPQVRVSREHDGQWMFAHWLRTREEPAASAKSLASKSSLPWTVALTDFAIDDGTLAWVDRVSLKPVFLEFSTVQTHVKNLSLKGDKPVPLAMSAKVRSARTDFGSLRFDGRLMWDPLVLQGALDVAQFPAQALAPYGLSKLRLDLLRADTTFKGELRFASQAAGPELQLRGDAAVEELHLNSLAAGDVESEELLSWKALSIPGIDLNMAPGAPLRLSLREVSLSDFFARLIVNPQGRLVLQDIVNTQDSGADVQQPNPATTAALAAAPTATQPDAVIDVGAIRLINGRVAFSDRFIKPNYSASLSELAGSLGHFSTQPTLGGVQMANLELRGRAEGTASLEITGKVNPLAKPLALNINAKVRDLELSPLSSYAIKYAGYGIERGKLSVDLNYSVSPDGQLQASNNIVLRQLVFGDAVEGAPSSLPVKLAVALLADSDGVIDVNLPVSGSLNDPQFRIWPIIWKIVGNLVAKALTSPFSLISGLLGADSGGNELSNVSFDVGTARIGSAGLQSLDKLAQALRDKPSLRLTIIGTASLEHETDAIKAERLRTLLLAEKRRAAASAGKDVTAVTDVKPDESASLVQELYRRSSVKKPRNLVGLVKDLSIGEMQALLLDSMTVDADAVRELALNRSLAVRDYLSARQLPSERLFLGELKTVNLAPDWQPRAELDIEHH